MSGTPAPLVQVRGLWIEGLISKLSFDLDRGQILAILGEDDRPRTALMQCLSGDRIPDGGTVRSPAVAAVWHADGLAEHEAVGASLTRALQSEDRARDVIASVGLDHRFEHEPWAMSAGERRRIAIAAAFATNAPLVLLDEPERGLDRAGLQWLAALASTEADEGRAIVVATFNEGLADQIGTVVVDDL